MIVGANASGKSNIRDAFRVLHGIGRRYTLAEIVGGKYGAGGQPEWGPIRGAPHEIANRKEGSFGLKVELALEGKLYCLLLLYGQKRSVLTGSESDTKNFG